MKKVIGTAVVLGLMAGIASAQPLARKKTPYYGNAQSTPFKAAIEGSTMGVEEQRELARLLPERADQRTYFRVQGLIGTRVINGMRNKSPTIYNGLTVTQPRIKDTQAGLELAYGYGWATWRGDVSVLLYKDMSYLPSPALSRMVPSYAMSSSVKHYTLLGNGFYDFEAVAWLQPYVMGSLGATVNSVKSSLINSTGAVIGKQTSKGLTPAFGLGAGIRSRVFSSLYLDVGYRALWRGPVVFKANKTVVLQGQAATRGFQAGLIVLM